MAAYTINTKTADYTIVAGDLGKIIDVTANDVTLTLTAASTLGSGFYVYIRNTATTATHEITIVTSGSETIDGFSEHRIVRRNEGVQLVCDGSNFFSLRSEIDGLSTNFGQQSSYNRNPTVTGNNSLALGYQAKVTTDGSTAIGYQAEVHGTYSDAIGGSAFASGSRSLALGGGHATGSNSISISSSTFGTNSTASADKSQAIGDYAVASGSQSVALGPYTDATGSASVAIGGSGTQSVGSTSVAIGNAYASGADSTAVSISNNSASYGATGANSIAMGYQNKASGSKSVAIGSSNQATNTFATAIGTGNYATYYNSVAIGRNNSAYAANSVVMGTDNSVNAEKGFASGQKAKARTIGQFARSSGGQGSAGEMQTSWFTLNCTTTDATTKIMGAENGSNGSQSTDQVFLVDDAALSFIGTIVACGPDGTKTGSWEIKGHLKNAAGTTTLPASIVNTIYNPHNWTVALTAHDAHNSLRVSVTGEASLEVWWSAQILSSEVVNN